MITIRTALAGNFLFNTLEPAELDVLSEKVWVENFAGGDTIVAEGDDADSLFLVVEGGVNVAKRDGQFLAFLGPGGFFGEMALFSTASKRTADVEAASDTKCAVVNKSFIHDFCNSNPSAGIKIYRAIIEALAQRLEATSADLAMLMHNQVKAQDDVSDMVARAKAAAAAKKKNG